MELTHKFMFMFMFQVVCQKSHDFTFSISGAGWVVGIKRSGGIKVDTLDTIQHITQYTLHTPP